MISLVALLTTACSTGVRSVIGPPNPVDRQRVLERVELLQASSCNCYRTIDCGSKWRWYCNLNSGCYHGGTKLDGTCADSFRPYDQLQFMARVRSGEEKAAIIHVVDLWFQAYILAAPKGGDGLPDRALLDQALAAKLPHLAHVGIKDTVFNVLDVLAGFDFALPRGNCYAHDPRCLGFFRIPLDPDGVRLLEAGRRGFVEALRTNDRTVAERALQEFWQNSQYAPHHTGRCYPHGHPEYAEADGSSPLACQQLELSAMLELIFAGQPGQPSRVLSEN